MAEEWSDQQKPVIEIRWRKIFRHPIKFLKTMMPFTTSHHPECRHYEGHYIKIGRYKLCIGCTFTYPTILAVLLIHKYTDVTRKIFSMGWEFLAALTMMYIVLYAFKIFDKHIAIKIASKIYLGTTLTLIILYTVNKLPYQKPINIVIAILLYLFLANTLSAIRGYKIVKTCRKCDQWHRFPLCEGFKNILEKLEKEGFVLIRSRS